MHFFIRVNWRPFAVHHGFAAKCVYAPVLDGLTEFPARRSIAGLTVPFARHATQSPHEQSEESRNSSVRAKTCSSEYLRQMTSRIEESRHSILTILTKVLILASVERRRINA
jgi:hypothetical protein